MSLKQKSKRSLDAGKLLEEQQLYCSSIHCYYYSCFQLMHYQLLEFLGEHIILQEYSKIKEEEGKDSGSHVIYLKIFQKFYKRQINKEEIHFSSHQTKSKKKSLRAFSDNIIRLKRDRVIADYKEELLSEEKAKEAHEKVKNCHQFIPSLKLLI